MFKSSILIIAIAISQYSYAESKESKESKLVSQYNKEKRNPKKQFCKECYKLMQYVILNSEETYKDFSLSQLRKDPLGFMICAGLLDKQSRDYFGCVLKNEFNRHNKKKCNQMKNNIFFMHLVFGFSEHCPKENTKIKKLNVILNQDKSPKTKRKPASNKKNGK